MKKFLIAFTTLLSLASAAQQKEVLLMGTMHTVPKIVSGSYGPMLKDAIKYDPSAIYVEYVRDVDTISLNYYNPKFVALSDSIAESFKVDEARFERLSNSSLLSFTEDDFKFMQKSYLIKRDRANYHFFWYLSKYGLEGSKKPLRNENWDLTAKLAIALDMKYVFSMDDQQTNSKYQKAWRECVDKGRANGDTDLNNKLNKKDYNKAMFPAVMGKLGTYRNKKKSLERIHQLNSFRYVQNPCKECDEATYRWDERNRRMAANIGEQVRANPHEKSIVIVGAGHIIGLREALEKDYPDITIKMMDQKGFSD
ncbi:MAG: DUF5694 domain-containing protein [Bacteroidota bacterium]